MKNLFTKTLLLKTLSVLLHLVLAELALLVVLVVINGFPQLETYSYLVFFWTLPFSLGLAVSSQTILERYGHMSVFRKLLLTVLISAFLAYAWELSLTQLLGPLNVALNLPIVYIWFTGAFIQLSFLNWLLPKRELKKEFTRFLMGILFFPMTAVLSLLLMYYITNTSIDSNTPEKEMIVLPADFEGEFRVVYGEKGGVVPAHESGRLVLNVPENGILVVETPFKPGTVDQVFFMRDNSGKTHKITSILDYKKRLEQAPGVLYWGPQKSQASWSRRNADGDLTNEVLFNNFTLYRKNSVERTQADFDRFQAQIDSLTNVIVVNCRKKN